MGCSAALCANDVIDSPMFKIPDLPLPKVIVDFPEEAKGLWLRALQRPETDLKIKAAQAIALAKRRGYKGIETAVEPLIQHLDRADLPPAARLAVAEALIALDARSAAPSLFKQIAGGGADMRQLVEPVLAGWSHAPARDLWRERLRDPATPAQQLTLAIQGLAVLRDDSAAERLRELALSERVAGPQRLEAARALGTIRKAGLEKDAEALSADPAPRGLVPRLLAAALLRQHDSQQARKILLGLALDKEPAVAAGAIARLLEVDLDALVPSAPKLLSSPDANVRAHAIEVLRRRPTDKHIDLLGVHLGDLDPDVRVKSRQALVQLAAAKELRDSVIATATIRLDGNAWRSLEQAAIVLTQLDHKPAAKRLVQILTHDRPEAAITAAWGLRKLAVAATLPDVTRHVEASFQKYKAGQFIGPQLWQVEHRLSQLNQLLGQQKYAAADPVLRLFIPKPKEPTIGEARCGAIWALGIIHEGKQEPELAAALLDRLNDTMSIPPEDGRVHRFCALSLGRLRSKDALPSLRRIYSGEPTLEPNNNAAGWAIEQITGEKMPPPRDVHRMQRDWFLAPN